MKHSSLEWTFCKHNSTNKESSAWFATADPENICRDDLRSFPRNGSADRARTFLACTFSSHARRRVLISEVGTEAQRRRVFRNEREVSVRDGRKLSTMLNGMRFCVVHGKGVNSCPRPRPRFQDGSLRMQRNARFLITGALRDAVRY